MGTYTLREKNITNFWSDTLSCYCKGILSYKDECLMQGRLSLIIDKTVFLHLDIDKTLVEEASKECADGISGESREVFLCDKVRESQRNSHCDRQSHANDRKAYSQRHDPVSDIQNFLSETLSSFCKNMIEYKAECSIQGKLCITTDKENAMLVDIQETVQGAMKAYSGIISPNANSKMTKKSLATRKKIVPNQIIQSYSPPPIVIAPDSSSTDNDTCEGEISYVGASKRKQKARSVANLRRAENTEDVIVIEPRPECEADSQSSNSASDKDKSSPYTGTSKRKRKQSNPTSLSRLESTPKLIVIEPQRKSGSDQQNSCPNSPLDKSHKGKQELSFQPQNGQILDLSNQLADGALLKNVAVGVPPPFMVHLLAKHSFDHLSGALDECNQQASDMSDLPPLASNQDQVGNLDALAERVADNSQKFSVSMSNTLPITPPRGDAKYSTVLEGSESAKSVGKSPSKSRYVNALLELPDDEVQRMLSALMASGQTKDTCDDQHCSICCPTLAYIRFRDRNRKNKSRFSMEKIEQVVNVQMYGEGTRYRDVQRMFTMYLRKLRAKYMCEKQCICCEKLLLRESKKPNSNYLPHNVTPYKNPPHVRKSVSEMLKVEFKKATEESSVLLEHSPGSPRLVGGL